MTDQLSTLYQIINKRLSGNGNDVNIGDFRMPGKNFYFDVSNIKTPEEFLLVLISLVPHLDPSFYQKTLQNINPNGGDFLDFGGIKGKNHRGIIPTGETAQFILAGKDQEKRNLVAAMLKDDAPLVEQGILYLEHVPEGEPLMSGKLVITQEYVDYFLTGEKSKPKFSPEFPAREIFTNRTWEDLVLAESVKEQIEELRIWVEHNATLMKQWNMGSKIKPGYRALFHGASGTGKTLTATLLGKYTQKPVFRVDLSTVVSKYIGETEKNLERLFQKARNRDWILFFDEADALFGKRTGVKDAHDRFANQEVSYLLQRVEDFDGLVILSSNFKANIDDAFLRRFNAIIKFPFPSKEERAKIATKAFPGEIRFETSENIPEIIGSYELSGGDIINVVQYTCLMALESGNNLITKDNVIKGIKREIEKEGKTFVST